MPDRQAHRPETQAWLNKVPGNCQCCAQEKDTRRKHPECCAIGECCEDYPSRRVIEAARGTLGEAWRDHGLVFSSSIGAPVEPRNVNRRWDELRRRAGLDWLRLDDLRHRCATLLLAKGVAGRVIMKVLGHAEMGVTMNTYAHVPPVLRQEAADAIDELSGA